jgi:hypothetical protein
MGCLLAACVTTNAPRKPHRLPTSEQLNEEVVLEGLLQYPVLAIGGETTGVLLETEEGSIEVELPEDGPLRARIEELAGERVRLRGLLTQQTGPERGARLVVRPVRLLALPD